MAHYKKFTPKRVDTFLTELKRTGNVSISSDIAGISKEALYLHRRTNADFNAQWEEALKDAADRLEEEARRRAYEGFDEPVFQGGKQVGIVRKYSDTLLIFLLKGCNPKKFVERLQVAGPDGGDVPVKATIQFSSNLMEVLDGITHTNTTRQ